MKNYKDFCGNSTQGFQNGTGAEKVFDFLCTPENIHGMIVMSDLGLPAISSVVKELEDKFKDLADFPLSDFRNRQLVGKMIKFILEQFGYAPVVGGLDERAQLRSFTGAHLFKTSSVYKKEGTPAHTLKMEIV